MYPPLVSYLRDIWDDFWRFFSEQFSYLVAESTQKWFFHQNNVRNLFSNIELPLGYNIMTLEYVLERTWKEIAKNMYVKKEQNPVNQALFGGGLLELVYSSKSW